MSIDRPLVSAMLAALRTDAVGIDRFYFDWRGGRLPAEEAYSADEFGELRKLVEGRQSPVAHPYWSDDAPCSMHIDEVEALWSAIADSNDWGPLEAKVAAIRRMGEAMIADAA